jgi:hypothetical protein
MKRMLMTLFVLVAALSMASVTLAQSEPAEDPKENACYAGGAWEGKCDWPTDAEDEWAWTCGWHYARLIDGRISADQYPEACGEQVSLLACLDDDVFYDQLCVYSDGSFGVILPAEVEGFGFAYPIGKLGTFEDSFAGEDACDEAAYALFITLYDEDDDVDGFSDFDVLAGLSNGADGYENDRRTFCVLLVGTCGCPDAPTALATERRRW